MKNPSSKGYIDIHCHIIKLEMNVFSLPSLFINDLSIDFEADQAVSIGLHPWHIKDSEAIEQLSVLEFLSQNENVLAIGECGLDRNISVMFETQLNVFKRQINIANNVKKPIIIHNVKSFSDILSILKNDDIKTPWIFHAYNANTIISKKLLEHDVYFSFGYDLFKDNSKASEIIKEIPLNRLFLETDDVDINISKVYKRASDLLKLDEQVLITNIYNNFIKVFRSNG